MSLQVDEDAAKAAKEKAEAEERQKQEEEARAAEQRRQQEEAAQAERQRQADEAAAAQAEQQRVQQQAAANDVNSTTVYRTKTGKCYHNAGCSYLKKSQIATTVGEAKGMGLSPCSKCNPPA